MRAAVLREQKHFELEEIPLPAPGPGQVRIEIEACGVCGSDLHYYNGGMLPLGLTPGHEIAGRVDAVGSGVTSPAVGDAVAVEPLQTCDDCEYCETGRDSICRDLQFIGFHTQGGMAQYIVLPARRAIPLAKDLDSAVAALTEPVAVSVHGLNRGSLEEGQRVLVLGAGTVGLVTLITAGSLGAGEVWVTARHAHQAELARRLGATRVLDERDAGPQELDRLGREVDFDLVVESVGGRADTLAGACMAARPGGTISVLGVFVDSPALAPFHSLLKELTLCWSNCYQRPPGNRSDFEVAAEIVDRERERLSQLTTHQLPLSKINDAFALANEKREGAIKVSVHPSQ